MAMAVALISVLLYVAVAAAFRVGVFADGGYQFLLRLTEGSLPDLLFALDDRSSGLAISQAPLWLADRAGVKDLEALQVIFTAGLFAHFFVMFVVCAMAARPAPMLLLFPVATFVLVTANIGFFAWTPSHVMVSLFWSLLFVLLLPEPWSGTWLVVALVLAVLALSAYESMAVLGIALAGAAFWRARRVQERWLRAGARVVGCVCLVGIAIAVRSIVQTEPRHFTRSFLPLWDGMGRPHGSLIVSLLAIPLVASANTKQLTRWRVGLAGLAAAGTGWLVLLIVRPETLSVVVHHMARSLNLSLVLVLFALFLTARRQWHAWSGAAWRRAWGVVAVVALIHVAWMELAGSHWRHYLELLGAEARAASGLVRFEDTRLGDVVRNRRPVSAFVWGWTQPLLSLFAWPDGSVRAVIANPEWYRGWEPFNPRDVSTFPQLRRLGIRYDAYAAALDEDVP